MSETHTKYGKRTVGVTTPLKTNHHSNNEHIYAPWEVVECWMYFAKRLQAADFSHCSHATFLSFNMSDVWCVLTAQAHALAPGVPDDHIADNQAVHG